ncbi:reverse transcriptase family protein [Yonghaparkia sp. Root332]|uniref:reverse transcriptase family protein n=1 Tax=Yonghaparkia sp. Root332 TaxID=1736516 RepID=UPI000AF4C646|nr:reverse transcriptase family protein [Yonghaparkia sp. Root332]
MSLPPHLFRKGALEHGLTSDEVDTAIAQRARLLSHGSYPLLTLGQLASETGASYTYLREVVTRSRDPYNAIAVPKSSGELRSISAPEPILMDVQRWMLSNLFGSVPQHSASFAYRRGVGIVQCANQHVGSRWMVKMDIHDFFDSVTESDVYRVFRRSGYSKLLSFELSRLATRAIGAVRPTWRMPYYSIKAYTVDRQGVLPQGGPTSGLLANAVAGRLDRLVGSYALHRSLVYTRYSDDLMLSAPGDFDRDSAVRIVNDVAALVRRAGFEPHRRKSRIIPPGARRVVLGLLVDDQVRLLPEHRRKIDVHIRGCEKYGLAAHAAHRSFESVLSFVNHVDGWISFAIGVEPDRGREWRSRFNKVLDEAELPHASIPFRP